MSTSRACPLLIGTVNPRSSDPALALDPVVPGTAGWRLFKMSGLKLPDYLVTFDRTNVCDGVPLLGYPDVAVLLGLDVAAAFGAERRFWERQTLSLRALVWVVPHPSGLNRLYNDCANLDRVRRILRLAVQEHRRRLAIINEEDRV